MSTTKNLGSRNALVIESRKADAQRIKLSLEPHQFKIFLCSDPSRVHQVLQLLTNTELILCCVSVPGAYDLLRELRNRPSTIDTPFLLYSFSASEISRYASKVIKDAGKALGATAYLLMPDYHPMAFWDALEASLPFRNRMPAH